jgi:hypothetical protein
MLRIFIQLKISFPGDQGQEQDRLFDKKRGKQEIERLIIRIPPCSRSGSSRHSRGTLVGAAELADLT